MATFNTTNYQKAFVDRPREKANKGEVAGRVRMMLGQIVLDGSQAVGDLIKVGKLPANSRVVMGAIYVNKSLGATGILDLGHAGGEDEEGNAIAADQDAFVQGADAGGQAAYKQSDSTSEGLKERFGGETTLQAQVTEALDGSVTDGVAVFQIWYVND